MQLAHSEDVYPIGQQLRGTPSRHVVGGALHAEKGFGRLPVRHEHVEQPRTQGAEKHRQESEAFTYRLSRMNLFIHSLEGKIELGNSYFNDLLTNVKADYLLANQPNDGSKGENGWAAERVPAKDPRLKLGEKSVTLSPRSANTMWILYFLYHLKSTGTAGVCDGDR
jgi:type I restriction-modification system DNA methylase subunit